MYVIKYLRVTQRDDVTQILRYTMIEKIQYSSEIFCK